MNEWEEKMLAKQEGRKEGLKEGRAEGREEGKRMNQKDIAKKMVTMGMDPKQISEATGLAEDEVRSLGIEQPE